MPKYLDALGSVILIEINGIKTVIEPGHPLWVETAARPDIEPYTETLTVTDYRRAVQAHVDRTAQTRFYDNGWSCASYTASTNPVWAAEAATFIGWRDAVWAQAMATMAAVEAGEIAPPTIAALIGELPEIIWSAQS